MTLKPTRIDKIEYYNNLPLAHLINEASCAETVLKSNGEISIEKLDDSKIIIDELNKRITEVN
jgi:hypothetical protein